MSKSIFSLFVDEIWIADFGNLSDLTLFIKVVCETYYRERQYGLTFKVKEYMLDDNGVKKEL